MQGKNVLTFVNSTEPNQSPIPQYDLSGDRVCIALFINRDGKRLDFFCHLKPPAAERVIRLYQDRNTYIVPSKDKDGGVEEVLYGSSEIDRSFFKEHQIAVLYGKEPLTPEQLDKIDIRNNIRAIAVSRGLLAVGNPSVTNPDENTDLPSLEELLEDSPHVRQFVLLSDDDGNEHRLELTHHFDSPSMKQTTEFKQTLKMKTITGGAQKAVAKYKDLGRLYDALIQRVDGVIGDRTAILAQMPFVWKCNAIQVLFQDATRKNA